MTTIDYGYDGLSRLLTANYSVGADYTYGYDVAGNLVNNNGVTRTYNAANQMVNDGTNTLTYDANGNLTSDGVNSLTWDRANRMLTAPGSTSYKYDGLGNRIQQTVSSVVTDYLNDVQPGLVKLLRQDDGTNVDHFVHAVRGIHAVESHAGVWDYAVQDGFLSVRGWADSNAALNNPVSYSPYGVPSASVTGFAYTGEVRDGTGLQYHRARYYNPSLAVWTAQDFLEMPNRYSYVDGNPINFADSNGLRNELLAGGGGGGGGAIVYTAASTAKTLCEMYPHRCAAGGVGLFGAIGNWIYQVSNIDFSTFHLPDISLPFSGTTQLGRSEGSGFAGVSGGATPPPNNNDFYNAAANELLDEAFDNITDRLSEIEPRALAALANSAWSGICAVIGDAIAQGEDAFMEGATLSNSSAMRILTFPGIRSVVGTLSRAWRRMRTGCPFPTNPAVHTMTTIDPPVQNLANEIQAAYPGLPMCVNRKFCLKTDPTCISPEGEIDIELMHIIIEYKHGQRYDGDSTVQHQITTLNKPTVNFSAKPIVYFTPYVFLDGQQRTPTMKQFIEGLPNVRAAFGQAKSVFAGLDSQGLPTSIQLGMTRAQFIAALPSLNVP